MMDHVREDRAQQGTFAHLSVTSQNILYHKLH